MLCMYMYVIERWEAIQDSRAGVVGVGLNASTGVREYEMCARENLSRR